MTTLGMSLYSLEGRFMRLTPISVVAGFAIGALTLSGCAGSQEEQGQESEFSVVTSTNVYADLASQIAGDAATVEPIISDSTQDPHDYEATPQDQLKLSKADLVVVNGGGYDAFMTTMLEAADHRPEVIDVVEVSDLPGSEGVTNEPHSHSHGEEGHSHETDAPQAGHEAEHTHSHEHSSEQAHDHGGEHSHEHETEQGHEHDHGSFNEHVWYSVPTMEKLAEKLGEQLSQELPDSAEAIQKRTEEVTQQLHDLHSAIEQVAEKHAGTQVAATEPVALWLFDDMKLDNVISEDFLHAVEAGSDVPPLVLKSAKDKIASGDVKLLAYNTQNAGPQAKELKQVAEENNVPVVDMAETMPPGTHYAEWMRGYVTAIAQALNG